MLKQRCINRNVSKIAGRISICKCEGLCIGASESDRIDREGERRLEAFISGEE